MTCERSEFAREQRIALYKSDQQLQQHTHTHTHTQTHVRELGPVQGIPKAMEFCGVVLCTSLARVKRISGNLCAFCISAVAFITCPGHQRSSLSDCPFHVMDVIEEIPQWHHHLCRPSTVISQRIPIPPPPQPPMVFRSRRSTICLCLLVGYKVGG